MMQFVLVLLLALSIAPAHAETGADVPQTSLFFSPQEARDAEIQAAKLALAGQGDISLGAIMYYTANDWTLWLRGERWTPQTSHEDLRVLDVSANEVHLSWREDTGSTEREITLRPHQTFQIATGKIITSP
jgi:hypothetical protein